jgi:hypothetical protein
VRRVLAAAAAALLVLAVAGPATALDAGVTMTVDSWQAGSGRSYVGVKADGRWTSPSQRRCVTYWTSWVHRYEILADPIGDQWSVSLMSCAGGAKYPLDPMIVVTTRTLPGIGLHAQASGVLRLDLGVAVAPQTAPAGTTRSVTAGLSGGWLGSVADDIRATIVPGSVRVRSWSVDFGDGSGGSVAANPADPLRMSTTHAYGAGSFSVTVTAHVAGRAYAAFIAPGGSPFETTVPWAVDVTNAASGVSGLPIEYVPPVVAVAGSPSGTLPGGAAVPPDASGHAAVYWPRGLPCALYIRGTIVTEGFMRSGGTVIGGGATTVTGYRYTAGVNEAASPTPTGRYPASSPVRIQWDTPLPGNRTYPVRVVLELSTRYDDGTVRTSTAAGTVSVDVVYSAAAE